MTAKEAIKNIQDLLDGCCGPELDDTREAMELAIKALEAQECKDAVDREELLRLLGEEAVGGLDAIKKGYGNDWLGGLHTAWRVIDDIPSAQPEIIRCKYCKYLQKWRSEESAKKFGQIYECARNVFDCPKPEDFCSRAERKTDE